jgi:hypothetical protein
MAARRAGDPQAVRIRFRDHHSEAPFSLARASSTASTAAGAKAARQIPS